MMSAVGVLPCSPNAPVMHDFVQRLFATSGVTGLVEISWTSTRAPHKLNGAKLADLGALDTLTDEAAMLNAAPSRNVYISAGLRNPGSKEHERAADADVFACVACWADFDKPGALEAAIMRATSAGMQPSIVTITGEEPHLRGQLWWVLEEPCEDLALHMRFQRSLAYWLSGDPTVVNPSRVMRIAGSVAWPLKAGRSLEMTRLDVDNMVRNAPFTMAEIEVQLKRANAFAAPDLYVDAPRSTDTGVAFDFSRAAPQLDLDDLIAKAKKPHEWHDAALAATAHLLSRGTPGDVILDMLSTQLQQPGFSYAQTRKELNVMVTGGVRRGIAKPASEEPYSPAPLSPQIEGSQATPPASPFLSIEQLLDLPPVQWMVENYLPAQGMSAMFSPPGAFKSFLALDLGLSVAYGLPWHGRATQQRSVLYVLAEGQHGFGARILAWREARAQGLSTDQFHVLPVPVNLLDPAKADLLMTAAKAHLPTMPGFIIIDTVARNFGTGDENSTRDMNAYVAGSSRLAAAGAHVLHVHHSGKDHSKDERGSSAFRGAIDTALKLDRDPRSDVVTLYVRKQKDGIEAKPLNLVLPIVEVVHPVTGEIVTSRVPTLGDQTVTFQDEAQRADAMKGLSKEQRDTLRLIKSGVGSETVLSLQLGKDRSNVARTCRRLSDRLLIKRNSESFWVSTDQTDTNEIKDLDE